VPPLLKPVDVRIQVRREALLRPAEENLKATLMQLENKLPLADTANWLGVPTMTSLGLLESQENVQLWLPLTSTMWETLVGLFGTSTGRQSARSLAALIMRHLKRGV
jgi:hypothetical protein